MDDQLREEAPLKAAQAWDSARRLREPVAWTLLALVAIGLFIGVWELFNLPGTPAIATPASATAASATPASATPVSATPVSATPANAVPPPPSATSFGVRASAVAPQFVADDIFALPIVSVILVAFAGGLAERARQVVQTAISIQAVTLGLGVLSWLGARGAHVRAGIWFIAYARELAIVAVGLILTVAVLRARALRSPTPQLDDFLEDDEDLGKESS